VACRLKVITTPYLDRNEPQLA